MAVRKKVLFICTGNVCRSLTAALLLEKLAREHGVDVETKSCGIAAQGHYTVPEPVWRELAKSRVERRPHIPQLVSRELLSWADIALTMERTQRQVVLDMFPEFTPKVQLLRDWAALDNLDIADPMGQSDAIYAACCAEIKKTIEAALERSFFNE